MPSLQGILSSLLRQKQEEQCKTFLSNYQKPSDDEKIKDSASFWKASYAYGMLRVCPAAFEVAMTEYDGGNQGTFISWSDRYSPCRREPLWKPPIMPFKLVVLYRVANVRLQSDNRPTPVGRYLYTVKVGYVL